MPPASDPNDDEYVAKLLAEDAKKSSIRYSSLGLSALLPKRPTTSAPKPNTRFLQSIIRETDNHNAALKKKEELEARIRLRQLRESGSENSGPRKQDYGRPAKRRRLSHDEDGTRDHRRDRDRERLHVSRSSRSRSAERRGHRSRRHHRRNHNESDGEDSAHRDRRAARRRRSKSISGLRGDDRLEPQTEKPYRQADRQHRKRRRRHSSSSSPEPADHPVRSRRDDRGLARRTSKRVQPSSRNRSRSQDRESIAATLNPKVANSQSRSSSSDPLEKIVGPLPAEDQSRDIDPPMRSRGRGAYRTSTSAMDAHFSATYDPKLDLHPGSEVEEEKEDWDLALEALKDREMWKKKHAERLREAGFDDEDIKKWKKSGQEKDVEDVKWAGKGESREWDLGKTAQEAEEKPKTQDEESGWRKRGGFVKSFKAALR